MPIMDRKRRAYAFMRTSLLLFAVLLLISPGYAFASEAGNEMTMVLYELPGVATLSSPSPRDGMSFSFIGSYQTAAKHYNGNTVGIEFTAVCSSSGFFTVQLVRGGQVIGSARAKTNGFSNVVWNNVGSGTYFFRMYCSLNETITLSNVVMYSW